MSSISTSPIASAGKPANSIVATFNPRFFALVSEHLYPSSNKAFEELITNSWDADASNVYVRISSSLRDEKAAIYVLDDGHSMDVSGFELLWAIADSKKRNEEFDNRRKRIGKFGIGKLATYLLCNELTYICKAADGIIRVVTMDYRIIDGERTDKSQDIVLGVREIDVDGLRQLLAEYNGGNEIGKLIDDNVPAIPPNSSYIDEFGGAPIGNLGKRDTWTLAILTSLKVQASEIEVGRTMWMLSCALPLSATMNIDLNGQVIRPSKSEVGELQSWIIGPDLLFKSVELPNGTELMFEAKATPYPHIVFEGLGEVTGTATVFAHSIATGKSNYLEVSNGCFINVLGRVINTNGEGQFSLGNSGAGTYSRFRAAIRADGLDKLMTIQRDSLVERRELDIVAALAKKLFNQARGLVERVEMERLAVAETARRGSINLIPVSNAAELLSSSLIDGRRVPSFLMQQDGVLEEALDEWRRETRDGIKDGVSSIEMTDDDSQRGLFRYELTTRRLLINRNHPFAIEHSNSEEQRAVLEDYTMINFLCETFLANRGIFSELVDELISYRDVVERTMAKMRRTSPLQIVNMLEDWNSLAKPLEEIVGDALDYLGFGVKRLGTSGVPDGIATAFVTPQNEGIALGYSFNYDAKSTTKKKVSTGNAHLSALARHRVQVGANYTLIVGRGFQEGAFETEAKMQGVTPITTLLLGKLLKLSMSFGLISHVKMEEMFQLTDIKEVANWINNLEADLGNQRQIKIGDLCEVLNQIEPQHALDVLSTSVIAAKYREYVEDKVWPSESDVQKVLAGLVLIAPTVIGMQSQSRDRVYLLTPPSQLLNELKRQVLNLHFKPSNGLFNEL